MPNFSSPNAQLLFAAGLMFFFLSIAFRNFLASIASHGKESLEVLAKGKKSLAPKKSGTKKPDAAATATPPLKGGWRAPSILILGGGLIVIGIGITAMFNSTPVTTGQMVGIGLVFALYIVSAILCTTMMVLDQLLPLIFTHVEMSSQAGRLLVAIANRLILHADSQLSTDGDENEA